MRKNSRRYDILIFDFDGVLVESNEIRFSGFRQLFCDYPDAYVEQLMQFVRANGGLSRYAKIAYFYRDVLKISLSESHLHALASDYSALVKEHILAAPAVNGSVEFLQTHQEDYTLAIVSGSDQTELRAVCQARKIDGYFVDILGSPTEKALNLSNLLINRGWQKDGCLYIGDSTNDYLAARMVGIDFLGRNSGLTDWHALNGVPCIEHLGMLSKYLSTYNLREI